MTGRLDAVLAFETLRTELQAVADEMSIALMRSSFSPVIRDFLDFSTALCLPDGRLAAQGFSLPLHLGAIPRAMEAFLDAFPDGLERGDVAILNDPYRGGMHLPDIFVAAPAFSGEARIGYAVVVAHHADIGGRVPGGSAADSREVFEEGLRIPPVRLREAGRWNQALIELLRANVRLPDMVWQDVEAQVASAEVGTARLADLAARRGEAHLEGVEAILEYSRRRLAAVLAAWPAGTYEFEDVEDHDGLADRPVPIRVRAKIGGERIVLDFEGTSPQVAGSINCTRSFTESACLAAVRALAGEDIPVNAGFAAPIEVRLPRASVVNAEFPAGVAARGVIGYRVIEAVFGALAQALPDRVPAAGDGGTSGIRIGGFRADGRRYQFNDIVCGAGGARPTADGLDGAAGMAANIANRPVELAERDDPVRVHAYELVPDSAGPGRHRGGMAVRRVVELLAPEGVLNLRTHRNRTPPYGLADGQPGRPSETWLERDGQRLRLPAKTTVPLRRGDRIDHTTASGGGHGPAAERSREAIAADLADGKVTPAAAARDYPGAEA